MEHGRSNLYGQGQEHWKCSCDCSQIHKCLSGTGSSNQMLSSSGAVGKSSSSAVASWEGVICAWCRYVVVIHVMLEWWRKFCSSPEWAVNWCTMMLLTWITGSYRAVFVRAGKHQMAVYRAVASKSLGECSGCCSAVVSGVVDQKTDFHSWKCGISVVLF